MTIFPISAQFPWKPFLNHNSWLVISGMIMGPQWSTILISFGNRSRISGNQWNHRSLLPVTMSQKNCHTGTVSYMASWFVMRKVNALHIYKKLHGMGVDPLCALTYVLLKGGTCQVVGYPERTLRWLPLLLNEVSFKYSFQLSNGWYH